MARVMAWNVEEHILAKVSLLANVSSLTRAQIINDALDMYFRVPKIKKELKKAIKELDKLIG